MKSKDIIGYLLAVLITIVGAWVGFIQTNQTTHHTELDKKFAVLDKTIALMNQTLELIVNDNDALTRLQKSSSKHWKIVSQHRDWINELMVGQDKSIKSWPDLE